MKIVNHHREKAKNYMKEKLLPELLLVLPSESNRKNHQKKFLKVLNHLHQIFELKNDYSNYEFKDIDYPSSSKKQEIDYEHRNKYHKQHRNCNVM